MKSYKPTSPGLRQRTDVEYRKLLSGHSKHKKLTMKVSSKAARNHRGTITVRHQGGGAKKLYRIIDFRQEKMGVPGRVETIEYDPYRSAFISLVVYADGDRRYVLAGKDMKVGDSIVSDAKTVLKPGNRMQLKHIPIGQFVYNVEIRPNGGGKLARSAGSHLEVLGTTSGFTELRMPSKEIRRISENCLATIGEVSNPEHNLIVYGKAGRSRHKGIRPTVRGSAQNPVDHPYGGGEGKQPRGTKRPKDVWGNVTGGRKTRNKKKWSSKHISKRRPKKR
ncbi:MAG: 50S ribosomal protein L2 [Candidatus Harrisonbacteria bacterium]|nr:50S ribosomal protein L2 [Candidatus Harrisonbacteria bacterium]